jgi:hypothetical protein
MPGNNPLVVGAVDTPVDPWAGVWIAEDIESILAGVRSGSWIETSLGAVSAGLDALAFVSDPLGALLQYGVAWILEHVRPLSEALDWLAGDPAQIAGHAQTWRNVAAALRDRAEELGRAARWDTAEWTGTAAEAYRRWSGLQQGAVGGLAGAAETLAAITEGAGVLVAGVRVMVRDAIAVLVSRLISYAAEEVFTLGLATPLVVEQVSSLCAAWAARIARWLRDLISSLARLRGLAGKIGEAIEALKKQLSRLTRGADEATGPVQGPAAKTPLKPPNNRHNLNNVRPNSPSKQGNTVVLPGTDVAGDLDDIAAGRANWNADRNCYEVNGRSYGVEASGTVYPISGPGFVNLSRPEYKVLKQLIASDGDINAAREALRRDPSVGEADWVAALAVFKLHKSYKGGA